MKPDREYRRIEFSRKLDVKRLQAVLSKAMRQFAKSPPPDAAPARVEGFRVESDKTTVFLSGNGGGLEAVSRLVGTRFPDARVTSASRSDALRLGPRVAEKD